MGILYEKQRVAQPKQVMQGNNRCYKAGVLMAILYIAVGVKPSSLSLEIGSALGFLSLNSL